MRCTALALAFTVLSVTAAAAADHFSGTWKEVAGKSTNNWGDKSQNRTRTYSATPNGGYDIKVGGTNSEGKPISNTLQAAGNVKLPAGNTSNAVKMLGATHVISRRVDDHTLLATYLKDDKEVGTSTSKVSADGSTLTMTLAGTSVDGKKLKATSVYQK